MIQLPLITKGKIFVGQTPALMKRVEASDGTRLLQADVNSIAYTIYDKGDSLTTPVDSGTGALSKTSVVFDTLQTDYGWTDSGDSTGYNFRWNCPGTFFEEAGTTYRIEVVITDTADKLIPLVFEILTAHLYSQEE